MTKLDGKPRISDPERARVSCRPVLYLLPHTVLVDEYDTAWQQNQLLMPTDNTDRIWNIHHSLRCQGIGLW